VTGHDEMLDRVAVYALGAVSPREASEISEHLKTCEVCQQEYRALSPVVDAVARSSETEKAPSRLLKARVMRAAFGRPQSSPWMAALAAAACLAIVLLGYAAIVLENTVAKDRLEIARQNRAIGDIAAAGARRYPFAKGEVVTRGKRLYVVLRALPALPRSRVYQAWTLAKGSKKMAPSLTFRPSGEGVAVLALPEDASSTVAVAVSIEPLGGSLQPTTAPIAVVRLRG
jgi:hypothetical protein